MNIYRKRNFYFQEKACYKMSSICNELSTTLEKSVFDLLQRFVSLTSRA